MSPFTFGEVAFADGFDKLILSDVGVIVRVRPSPSAILKKYVKSKKQQDQRARNSKTQKITKKNKLIVDRYYCPTVLYANQWCNLLLSLFDNGFLGLRLRG